MNYLYLPILQQEFLEEPPSKGSGSRRDSDNMERAGRGNRGRSARGRSRGQGRGRGRGRSRGRFVPEEDAEQRQADQEDQLQVMKFK